MSRIVSVWLRAWPIVRLLRAQASAAPADAAIDPRSPAGAGRAGQGRRAHRLAQPGGAGERARRGRASVQRPLQGARPAMPRCRSGRRCRRPAQARAVVPALYPRGGGLGRGERRRRPVPRHHGLRASPRRRGGAAGRPRASACAPSASTRAGHRRHRGRGLGHGAPWSREARGKPDRAAGRASAPRSTTCRLPRSGCRRPRSPLMRRLGFQRIGELMPTAARAVRGPLRARGAAAASTRRWGARPSRSSLSWRRPPITPARTSSSRSSAEEHVLEAATRLLRQLAEDLERDGVGARVLRLAAVPDGRGGAVAGHRARRAEPGCGAHRPADRPAPRSPGRARWRPTSASRRRPCTCWSPSRLPSARTRSASTRRLPRPRRSPG